MSHLTIDNMYSLYETSTEQSVCYKVDRCEFLKMNLKFKKLHVDTCHTCNRYAIQLKITNEEENQKVLSERNLHHAAQEKAYSEMIHDILITKENQNMKCFDKQQCLPTSALNLSVAFYKRQLWIFNVTCS